MTNEATLIVETEPPINFTCDNSTGIEKGTILKLSDPMTAAASDGDNDLVAGIAAEEKIESDGKTKIAVYRGGIFKVTASGSVAVGDPLGTDGAANNYVASNIADANLSGAKQIGIALEAASDDETFLMELRPNAENGGVTA